MASRLQPILLSGSQDAFARAYDASQALPVDESRLAPEGWEPPRYAATISRPAEVEGSATYHRGRLRRLAFLPAPRGMATGWVVDRVDLPEQLPIPMTLGSVCRADRAIVLRSGVDANRFRMSEHVICHRLGLGIDNIRIETDSEDPPLFDEGSMPIVRALLDAGLAEDTTQDLRYISPSSPVVLMHPSNGGFLLWEPARDGSRILRLDVSIDFPNAIGQERVVLDLHPDAFIHGAIARTNCSASEMRKARLFGWLSPEIRNLGYTRENILLAGKKGYVNEPKLLTPAGKSLEPVWHRTCLDLVAALSLMPPGCRPAGKITSFKSGHVLDVRFLTLLFHKGLIAS